MNTRRVVAASIASFLFIGVGIGLYLFQPWRLVTNTTVNESLPSVSSSTSTDSSLPEPSQSAPRVSPTQNASILTLAAGSFISHEHVTTGRASVLQLPDGSRILRLTNVSTSDGPDLKVWITDAPVIAGKAGWRVFDDGSYVNLGNLKANKGNQNYAIPSDVDFKKLTSVSIWCDRFNVSFGAVQLKKP